MRANTSTAAKLVRFGKCCSPVPGDPISGWITRGRGVTVHRRGCKRALELEPERRIDCRAVKTFQVQIADVSKLHTLMRQLAKVEGVHDVERI